jgi:hypothetical protein
LHLVGFVIRLLKECGAFLRYQDLLNVSLHCVTSQNPQQQWSEDLISFMFHHCSQVTHS